MELLFVPVPLFDKEMAVQAYLFRHQKGNNLVQGTRASRAFDGVMRSPALEMLETEGVDAFTMGKPIFVPINAITLLAEPEKQCSQPPENIIFLLDGEMKPAQHYLDNMERLRKLGYRFALQKLDELEPYRPFMEQAEYLFLDNRRQNQPGQSALMHQVYNEYKHISIGQTHINTLEIYNDLRRYSFSLFEGRFYRVPITKGNNKISPLKVNLIRLMNLVQDENFEFDAVSTIIQRDTSLTVSLLRMINSPALGVRQKVKTINHAVTMLGQIEVRKWVTAAVSKSLGADKPDEITRLSLVRARFAELLAENFGLELHAQALFLMGLFSVLDVILEIPMSEALQMVRVSDPIRDALESKKGDYAPVYQFMQDYEAAEWSAVSRAMILYDITPDQVHEAFAGALGWYRDLANESTGE